MSSLKMSMAIYNDPSTGITLSVAGTMMTQGQWNAPAPSYGDQINYGTPYYCTATQPDIKEGGVMGDLYLQVIGAKDTLSIKFNLQQATNSVTLNGKTGKVILSNNLTCYAATQLLNNVLTVSVGIGAQPPSEHAE
jgi:hypothetical protein